MKRSFAILASVATMSVGPAQQNPLRRDKVEQAAPRRAYDVDEIAQLAPELAALPAPDWVKPGARLTYLKSSGTVQGDGQLIEDPKGLIEEKRTGKKYRWVPPRGLDPRHAPIGAGGASVFSHIDVAAADGTTVAIDEVAYGYDALNGTLAFAGFTGAALPSGINTWWANPAALQKLIETGMPGHVVFAMPYLMDGVQYRAVRLHSTISDGSHTYDAVTGALLRSVSVSQKPSIDTVEHGQFVATRNVLVFTRKDMRQMKLPWQDAAAPDWAGQLRSIAMQGTTLYVTPGQLQQPPVPLSVQSTILASGKGWLRYRMAMEEMGAAGIPMNSVSERACGNGSIGGLWISPKALKDLRFKQVIDEDPVTKVVTSVTFTGPAPDGIQAVGISQISPKTKIDNYYDLRTGMLKRVVLTWETLTGPVVKTADIVSTQ